MSKQLLDPRVIQKRERHAHQDNLSKSRMGFVTSATAGVFTAMNMAVAVQAAGNSGTGSSSGPTNGFWKDLGTGLVGFIENIRPFVIAIVVLALVVDGVGCVIGGEQSREKFKHALPWIIGGAVVILLAGQIAVAIVNSAGNNKSGEYKQYITQAAGTGLIAFGI